LGALFGALFVGAGLAGEQLIAMKAISWCQSAWLYLPTMFNQMLWNQKRRLKDAFLFAGKPAPTKFADFSPRLDGIDNSSGTHI